MSKAGEMAPFAQTGYGYPSASQHFIKGDPTPETVSKSTTLMQQSPIALELSVSQLKSLTPGTGLQSINMATPNTGQNDGTSPFVGTLSSPCCENGRIILADPVSGKTVCTCQCDSMRIALSDYTRLQPTAANMAVYATSFSTSEQSAYPSLGVDGSTFYPALSNPYPLRDNNSSSEMNGWTPTGLQSSNGFFSYDPPLAAYGYGASYDLAARRKNATRASTATLKAWLNEHKKNPYPTKGEKIMLAIITKMTLTQVSTWFANARRRLKKENKMTWEPKNRAEDDDDANASDEEKDREEHGTCSQRTNAAVIVTTGIAEGNVCGVDFTSGLKEVGVIGEQPKGYSSNPLSGNSQNFPVNYMHQHWDEKIQMQPTKLKDESSQIQADDLAIVTSGVKVVPNIWNLSRVESSEENLKRGNMQGSEQHRQDNDLSPHQQNKTSFVASLSIHANKAEHGYALGTISVPKPWDVTGVPPHSSNVPSFAIRKPKLIYKDQCYT